MGAAESVEPDVLEAEAALEPTGPSAPLSADDQPALLSLPLELLHAVCARLALPALSSLASTCTEARGVVPDDVWSAHLASLSEIGNERAPPHLSDGDQQRRLTTMQRTLIARAAAENAEAAQFARAVVALSSQSSSFRRQVGMVRKLVCALCQRAPAGAMYFPATERGVCHGCVRTQPAAADSWRHYHAMRERATVARLDASTGERLANALSPHLPLPARQVAPRLLYSSASNGGSLATLLRAAQGSTASLLLITECEAHGSPRRSFGAFCPVPWPRAPGERPATYFGDGSTFLFALEPELLVRPATGRDANFFRCDPEHGLSIGGDALLPALRVQHDLGAGRCLPSHTFGDSSGLASSTDFAVASVRLWDLTPPEPDADPDAASAGEELDRTSVLSARRADAMMLPFRTSMLLRVE